MLSRAETSTLSRFVSVAKLYFFISMYSFDLCLLKDNLG